MHSRLLLKTTALLTLLVVVCLTACKRNDTTDNNYVAPMEDTADVNLASDHAMLEREDNDVQSITETALANGGANLRTGMPKLGPCATVTHDTATRTVIIDFGTTNCTGADGRDRRGQIIVHYTGRYKDSGSVHTVTYNNYYVDDNQRTGSRTVTNMGTNASGQIYYTIHVHDSLILNNGKGVISWESQRTRTWIQGYNTFLRGDDVYEIAGSATITRANGNTGTINITSPLQVAVGCRWIQAGIVVITPANGGQRTIDYGTGTCDNKAELTVNGNTRTITLR